MAKKVTLKDKGNNTIYPQTKFDAVYTNSGSSLEDILPEIDWFFYAYGEGTQFSNNSVYIKTLGIFKKDSQVWTNLDIDDEFTITNNYNLVLHSDGIIEAVVSNEVLPSDVVLLIHSYDLQDWIGGALYVQYLQQKFNNSAQDTNTYILTNAVYGKNSVTVTAGKLWWINKYNFRWDSTEEFTETFTFAPSSASFLVLDRTNNTVVLRESTSLLLNTDVILLTSTARDQGHAEVDGGWLYPDYIKKTTEQAINSITDNGLLDKATYGPGSIMNNSGVFALNSSSHCMIPVDEEMTITMQAQEGKVFVYTILANNTLVDGERAPFAPGYNTNIISDIGETKTIQVPVGGHYLCLLENAASDHVNYMPEKIEAKIVARYGERVDLSEEYKRIFRENIGISDSSPSSGTYSEDIVRLRQGAYSDNLSFISDDAYHVSTVPIRDGKLIEVNDEYRIEKAVLLDSNFLVADVPSNIFLSKGASFNFPSYTSRTSWGVDNLPEGYYLVVSFVRADGGTLSPEAPVIKNIYDIHSSALTPVIPNNPQLENSLKRSEQIQRLEYKPLAPLPVITDYSSSAYTEVPVGATCIGMMYCSAKELDKYVPTHVSLKTFMSALHNKRSLIYTEVTSLSHSRSSYGFTYHGTGCATYYGINCNYNVGNVIGIIIPRNTGEWPSMSGITKVYDSASSTEFDIQNLKPLDIIDRSGHICVVTNIYQDKFGKNKIIAFSEANVTYARTSLYTAETFLQRLHQGDYDHPQTNVYGIYRYSYPNNGEWENVYNRSEYIKASYEEVAGGKYNDDICTFAGDEAKFIEGEKVVLNINRGSYTQCLLYKDNALYQTIDLNTSVEEIDLDLSSYNLIDGSYKARLTDGENYSDYTYFEVYDLSLLINANKTAIFSSTRLTPLYFELQSIAGVFYNRAVISEGERSSGQKTLTWAFDSNRYLKLFARTPDGYLITKRIVYNA